MKSHSKLAVLVLVCLPLAACNKPVEEEKTSAKEIAGNETVATQRKLPECAQRNKDGTYKYGHGCSAEQWVEWQKALDAMAAPSK